MPKAPSQAQAKKVLMKLDADLVASGEELKAAKNLLGEKTLEAQKKERDEKKNSYLSQLDTIYQDSRNKLGEPPELSELPEISDAFIHISDEDVSGCKDTKQQAKNSDEVYTKACENVSKSLKILHLCIKNIGADLKQIGLLRGNVDKELSILLTGCDQKVKRIEELMNTVVGTANEERWMGEISFPGIIRTIKNELGRLLFWVPKDVSLRPNPDAMYLHSGGNQPQMPARPQTQTAPRTEQNDGFSTPSRHPQQQDPESCSPADQRRRIYTLSPNTPPIRFFLGNDTPESPPSNRNSGPGYTP